jgi:hypothetical protein
MESNREYALSSTWEELGMMSKEVEPPHHVRLESGHKVWKDGVFSTKFIPVQIEMIDERVCLGLFEPT